MRTVTYPEVRQNLAKMLDHVVDDAEEVVVTRSGREAAVIISLREYESLKETAYLMASPAILHLGSRGIHLRSWCGHASSHNDRTWIFQEEDNI